MRIQHSSARFIKKLAIVGVVCVIGVSLGLGMSPILFPSSEAIQISQVPSGAAPMAQPASFSFSSTSKDILGFNQHLISISKKVKPAVVNISIIGTKPQGFQQFPAPFFDDPLFRRFFGERFKEEPRHVPKRQQQGMGSGVIVSPDGYIVTNNHVVEAGDEIQVTLGDKRTFEAKLIGTDPKTDLAIVKIDADDLPFLSWGDSSKLEVGEMVVAVGNPFGLSQTVTMGIISAVGRANVGIVDYEDFIQTDAAINPGNSGGALVNLHGELIGVNTAIFSRSGGYMGIGFAIPSNMAKAVTQSLQDFGKVVRGWLGVSIQDLTPELVEQFEAPDSKGALVADVVEDSPAHDAKFQRGDIIRKFDGRTVESSNKLRTFVAETVPDTKVKIEILRDGEEKTLMVKLGELPKDLANLGSVGTVGEDHALAGLTVESAGAGRFSREDGVRVTRVAQDSRAARAGIQKDDIILEINRKTIEDVEDFEQVSRELSEDDAVLVLLKRGNATIFLTIGRK
jgi:Do/DeqQ family serine protease